MGSANFTKAATTKNQEMSVLISSSESDEDFSEELLDTLNEFFNYGEIVDDDWLRRYRQQWKRNQKRLDALADSFGKAKGTKSIIQTELLMMEWPEYYDSVKQDEIHSVEGRVRSKY